MFRLTLLCLLTSMFLLSMPTLPTLAGQSPTDKPNTAGVSQDNMADDEEFDDPFANDEVVVRDPVEPFNRAMFWANDKLYFYLLKPIARGYRVVPETARVSVGNFFSNLGTPVRLVNSVLQFKFDGTGREIGRFVINSTAGLLGLFDPAKSWLGLEKQNEDFGQTLGVYGAGPGFYLVLPIFGPSSVRDGIGLVGDYFADPISSPWYFKLRTWEQVSLKSADRINALSLDQDTYESIKKDALDPYLTIRDAYLQHRAAKISN